MNPIGTSALGSSSSTSTGLLNAVKGGDPEAWRRLAQLYGPEVYRWARQAGLQDTDAADTVQEVFLAVSRNIAAFRRDRPGDSFRGWLWTITRSKIRDHFRRLRGHPQATGGSDNRQQIEELPESPPEESSVASISGVGPGLLRRILELIRTEFEDQTWNIFWRATVDGHAAAEIAADFGMTNSAVRQAKYRVLRRLRQELEGLSG